MKPTLKLSLLFIVFLLSNKQYGQHHSKMIVEVNVVDKVLNIQQDIVFYNQSTDTIATLVLNDWMHAYSHVNSALAKRFSDEFYRGFHLASESERGDTQNLTVIDQNNLFLEANRDSDFPDVININLRQKLAPNQKTTIRCTYKVKIPSDKFTKFGYNDQGIFNLKDWCLTPARYQAGGFVKYENENLDDIASAPSDFEIDLKVPTGYTVTSDLETNLVSTSTVLDSYHLEGQNRLQFALFVEKKNSFYSFKNQAVEVVTNIADDKITDNQKGIIIDCVVHFANSLIGQYPCKKIVVSQTDYDRNPFYGLNQLPSFISPFTDNFTYEIKFLKTYLNVFLKNSLLIDQRKEAWIQDAIQVYTMMKYIESNHPNSKMLGSLSSYKLLKGFNLTKLDFNEQYSYYYMLMARKNLDQPLNSPKNTLIKFNEQIASKYRAGLSLRYLDNYLENDVVPNSIKEFYNKNNPDTTSFETVLKQNSPKDIDWFFSTIINSKKIIDYKFHSVSKTADSISFTLKNKTKVAVPMPVYGIKNGAIVFKKWIKPSQKDSLYVVGRNGADKIVLNYKNEVPEFNLRNNWKSLKGFFPNNRPLKFTLIKDLEDPYYNQVLYEPNLEYNIYDGFIAGLRLHNRTILDKPFNFDVTPAYSMNTQTLSGYGSFAVNQFYREGTLFSARYSLSGSYYHYAPDAFYTKLNPTVSFRFRNDDLRDNKRQILYARQVIVNKEQSAFIANNNTNQNYSVFNLKYFNSRTEVTNHFSFLSELQVANNFSKAIVEVGYRQLFENNHSVNLRLYAGSFLTNQTNSDFFSFSINRPTDYMFDYSYYGRSEDSGLFSQQYIIAEGGFKSKFASSFANQWMTTLNGGYNIWNWVEVYGDAGLYKNTNQNPQFLYDSGIRLNLVTDYFEVYFPVYSSNGFELGQTKYNEKIRFMFSFSTQIIINLFSRKWF